MRADRLALYVFIDAFGWELMRHRPLLPELLTERRPLKTVLGYSCACDPTILTGLLPREHGHFSFFVYAPERSPFKGQSGWLSRMPRWLTNRGRVRRRLSLSWLRRLGYTGYFNLYQVPLPLLSQLDYTEKRDLFRPGGINGGQRTVFDRLQEAGVPTHISDWRRCEAENIAELGRVIDRGQTRVAYLYLAELDGLLHASGPGAAEPKLAQLERALRELYDRALRRYRSVELTIFSDHGMTAVTQTTDVWRAVERSGCRWGHDYAAVYDSTMARFWWLRPEARTAVTHALRSCAGKILGDEELARLGCDFPDRRYGDLIWLADPGVLINPSFMGRRPIAGMHGYHPDHADSSAAFATTRRDGPKPYSLTDLHDVMLDGAGVLTQSVA